MSRALAWVPALLLLGSLQARAQPSPDPADAAQPAAPPPAETTPAAEPGPEPGPDPSPDPSPEPGAEPGAEPGPEPSAEPWPDRFQPLELGDEEARLRLSFIAQLQLSIENREAGDGQRQTDSSARIRRIRTLLRGAFLDGRVQSTLHLEVAPGAAELIDLFVDVALTRGLRLRVGQFKIPLTQYWQQSLTQLGTLDWSITSRTFGGERQLGLMAHDGAGGGEGLRYALGLFAGENRRGALARELPRIYGESHGNASSLLAPRPAGALHAELVGRVGHFAAELHPETLFDAQGGGLRHGLSFSAAWDTEPEHARDWGLRLAPEILLKWRGLSLVTIGYFGLAPMADGALEPAGLGVLVELGWQPHRRVQIGLRYARVALLEALRGDARVYAQALRPTDPADLLAMDAWDAAYGGVGALEGRHELSLAIHTLLVGRSLAWQNDLSWLRAERAGGARDDLRLRSQLQLAF